MKYKITIPNSIIITNGKEKQEVSFKEFLYNTPLMDNQFHQNYETLLSKESIIESMIDQELILNEKDWKLLQQVIKYPSSPYNQLAYQYLVFMKAIVNAKRVEK